MGRILRIELCDFKSFKGSQTIGPFKPFTAVIGPNGSGKSNLMDAISFVVGVDTKHLRGDHLNDLVYNADGRREELRREASVTLVYVPSPGELKNFKGSQELQFERIILHSGACRYRFQGKTVSKSDYVDRLKDIGVLVKARNFLVFQGDVENIASKSATQLMQFFDEISESHELRERYEELARKKYAAETDTIFAYKQKKGILQEKKTIHEQKVEMERFNQKRKELEMLETDLFLMQLWITEREINESQEKLQELEGELDKVSHQEHVVEKLVDERKKDEAKASKRVVSATSNIRSPKKTLSNLEPASIKINEQLSHLKKKLRSDEEATKTAKNEVTKQKTEREEIVSDISKLTDALKALKTKLEETKKGNKLSSKQMDQVELIESEALNDNLSLQAELDTTKRNFDIKTERLETLQRSIDAIAKRKDEDESKANSLMERYKKMTAAIQKMKREEEETKAQVKSKRKEFENLKETRKELEQKLLSANQLLDLAKSSKVKIQRERKQKEFVENLRSRFPGVKGRLVDLCSPTSRKYDLAVSVALGRQMDSIVVDNESTGIECVNYLRDKRSGVATFLPLDTIEPKATQERHRQFGSQYKLALDVLDYDQAVEKAIQYALAGVIVCESLSSARELCFRRGERVKAVTIDGHIIAANADMTGGFNGESAGGRFEQKELESARRNRDEIRERISELDDKLFEIGGHSTEVSSIVKEYSRVTRRRRKSDQVGGGELQDLEMAVANAENRLKFAQIELSSTKEKLESLKSDVDAISKELKRTKPEKQKLEAALAEDRARIEKLTNSARDTAQQRIDEFGSEIGIKDVYGVVERYRAGVSKLNQNISNVHNQKTKLESQLRYIDSRTLEDAVKQASRKANETAKLLKSKEQEAEKTSAKLDEAQKKLSELESKLESEKAILEEKRVEAREAVKARDRVLLEKGQVMQKITSFENKIEKLRSKRHDTLRKAELDQIRIPFKSDKKKPRKKTRATRSGSYFADSSDDESEYEKDSSISANNEGDSLISTDEEVSGKKRKSDEMSSDPKKESLSQQSSVSYGSECGSFDRDDSTTVLKDEKTSSRVDFDSIASKQDSLSGNAVEAVLQEHEERIHSLREDVERMQPNMKANERWGEVSNRLESMDAQLKETRELSQEMDKEFERIKAERQRRFMACFSHVEETIDHVYRELTRSSTHPLGGNAYLSLDNETEPYLGGVKYIAMPPTKRFRDMEQLSGGEKTVAALALLFAIHSFHPAPFFVMDECDAALDNANVQKVSNYVRKNSSSFQSLIISLKDTFYSKADSLVGIYREQKGNCSKSLTLDMDPYKDENIVAANA